MASHKSALKRARQNTKHRERNSALRSKMKTEVKKAVDFIMDSKTREDALKALTAASKALQKAASKGVVPRARAARSLSRIAARLNGKFEAKQA